MTTKIPSFVILLITVYFYRGAAWAFEYLLPQPWWGLLCVPAISLLTAAAILPELLKREKITLSDLGYHNAWTKRDILLSTGIAVFHLTLTTIWECVKPHTGANYSATQVANSLPHEPLAYVGLWLSFCLMGPLLEEIVVRGGLLGFLRCKYGDTYRLKLIYVIFSALIFSVSHTLSGTIDYAFYFTVGLIDGTLFFAFGSLNALILAHGLFNAAALLLK